MRSSIERTFCSLASISDAGATGSGSPRAPCTTPSLFMAATQVFIAYFYPQLCVMLRSNNATLAYRRRVTRESTTATLEFGMACASSPGPRAAIRHFPSKERLIVALTQDNEGFRDMCDELAAA